MPTPCETCSGKGWVAGKTESGAKFYDKCPKCRGSGRDYGTAKSVSANLATSLIEAADRRRAVTP